MPSDPALEAKFEAWKKRNAIDYSPLYRSGHCWWCSFKRVMFKRKLRKDARSIVTRVNSVYKRPQ